MFAAFSSSFMTTPGITSRIQLMLSLYGRTWIRENSSSRCSPRMDAYRMFVSTPRIRSSYSASRFAVAVSPIGSTKPAQRRAEFSQSRYSGESSSTLTRNAVGVPRMSTSGNSSFEPPVPREATVIRSMRPLIAPRASCIAGNSAICPFSRSSRKLMSTLGEEPVHHPFRVEGSDVLVCLPEVHEHDRLADRLGHGQCGAPLRVCIDLRQDDPVDADRLVELLRLLDRVVPRERVPDVQGEVRLRDAFDLLHLVHQVLVRLHPARGVNQDDVPSPRAGVLDRVERDGGGIRPRLVLDQFEADRLRVFLELLDGPRPERVRGGDDAGVAFLVDVVRELRNRRLLARVSDCAGGHVGLGFLLPTGEPLAQGLEHLVPLARSALRLEPIVQVLHGRSLGLGAALQLHEPLADRIRRVRDRLDPPVEALDLLLDVVVHE